MDGMNMVGRAMQMTPLDETTWEGMVIQLATAPPATHSVFQGDAQGMITPTAEDSIHLMAVLADEETSERIPYANVWVTVKDQDGTVLFDERMWPMLSQSMGMHYGINVPLPGLGQYKVSLLVGPPQAARHPEYMERWLESFTFETTFEWGG
ncbi:MAG: iron transporter [Dehalococcoidia bacterium]|nr:iron transporter [Dehalococcoidia bacterium]MCZ7579152.1 iron transporter [Dehalococcoidia bacterium]